MGIPLHIQTNITILIHLLALSISGGLIITSLFTPRRGASNISASIFSLALGLSALLSLMQVIPALRFGIPQEIIAIALTLVAGLIPLAFFVFAYVFTGAPRLKPLIIPILLLGAVGLCAAFTQYSFSPSLDASAFFYITHSGLLLLASVVIALIVMTVALFFSEGRRARQLRWPALCMVGAYLLSANPFAHRLSLDTLLIIIAVVQSAGLVLYHQWSRPMDEMREKMEQVNQTLRLAFGELHRQRNTVENLHLELVSAYHHRLDMLATMSHELRTPLNSIIGYSELLQSQLYGDLNEKQSDRLERIHRNGLHLAQLINSILDLNNAESGQLNIEKAPVAIADLYDALANHFRPLCDKKNLALEITLPPDLPPVWGDFQRLQQALSNLLDNAVKFTAQGRILLAAEARRLDEAQLSEATNPDATAPLTAGYWVILRVEDSGIGISEADQARIFDRFTKMSGARYGGIGLGLAIAAKLVSLQGGQIWVKSQLYKGSCFYIALPAWDNLNDIHTQLRYNKDDS